MSSSVSTGFIHRSFPLRATVMALTLVSALVLSAGPSSAAGASSRADAPHVPGMVIVESDQGFESTWAALIGVLEANPNINVIGTVDHGAAATSAGLELANNRVVFFGNPQLGTPLMQVNQAVGIDLPQKIQVFTDVGRVWVGFNDTTYLQSRHQLGDVATLDVIAGALRNLTSAATATEVDGDDGTYGVERFANKPGLFTVPSNADVDTTWARLLAAIEASPANVALMVDHQAGAASVGLDLRPTRLVVFGNPRLGTPLMQKSATAGIDLPVKILVWEAEDGQTYVSTNNERLARRHRIPAPQLETISGAVSNFVNVASGS